ncbi:MAG: methyltransferase domain-containing protein [Synergistales bacterium]|nr:methyltransferase domain-containing protein [Synergistales bacterium]
MVLDLGSGAGLDLLIAAKRVGPSGKVTGVDMTDEMIAVARAHILASGLVNVEVRKGLIEELPVDDSSVDWVISNCVINLSPEKERVFSEIARVLKSGGEMLLSDIVAEELPEWIRSSESLYCSCIGGAISEEEYLQGLTNSGFIDLEVRASATYGEEEIKGYVNTSNEVPPLLSIEGETMSRNDAAEHYSAQLSGKVRNIQIHGRKP